MAYTSSRTRLAFHSLMLHAQRTTNTPSIVNRIWTTHPFMELANQGMGSQGVCIRLRTVTWCHSRAAARDQEEPPTAGNRIHLAKHHRKFSAAIQIPHRINGMRTWKQQEPSAHAARNAVLYTTELLESILASLDMQSLLMAQRVDRHFKAIIDGSPHLQQLLFFRPAEKREGLEHDKRTCNPLLRKHFTPWFERHKLPYFTFEDITELPWAKHKTQKEAIMRPSASWRRMLVAQPSVEKLGCWITNFPDHFQFRIFHLPHGLRMGKAYDLTQRWLTDGSNPHVMLFWDIRDRFVIERLHAFAIMDDERRAAAEKCIGAADLLWHGEEMWPGHEPGYLNFKPSPEEFRLRKLQGTEILGPESNDISKNPYKTVTQFAAEMDSLEKPSTELAADMEPPLG